MSSKRPSLAARLSEVAGMPQRASFVVVETPTLADPASAAPQALSATTTTAKARAGKTMVAGYFTQEMARAVRMLAVERGVSVQSLIGEGLDAVLRQNGKHPFNER